MTPYWILNLIVWVFHFRSYFSSLVRDLRDLQMAFSFVISQFITDSMKSQHKQTRIYSVKAIAFQQFYCFSLPIFHNKFISSFNANAMWILNTLNTASYIHHLRSTRPFQSRHSIVSLRRSKSSSPTYTTTSPHPPPHPRTLSIIFNFTLVCSF